MEMQINTDEQWHWDFRCVWSMYRFSPELIVQAVEKNWFSSHGGIAGWRRNARLQERTNGTFKWSTFQALSEARFGWSLPGGQQGRRSNRRPLQVRRLATGEKGQLPSVASSPVDLVGLEVPKPGGVSKMEWGPSKRLKARSRLYEPISKRFLQNI